MIYELSLISASIYAASCSICCLMLWVFQQGSFPKKILAIAYTILTVFTISIVFRVYFNRETPLEQLDFSYSLFCLLFTSFIFLYFRSLILPEKSVKRYLKIVIINIIAYTLLYCILVAVTEPVHLYKFNDIIENIQHPIVCLRIIVYLHFFFYAIYLCIKIIHLYIQYKEKISTYFLYGEEISLSWLPYLFSVFVINLIGTFFSSFLSNSHLVVSFSFYTVIYIIAAFLGVTQRDIDFNNEENGNTTDSAPENVTDSLDSKGINIPPNVYVQLVNGLKVLMEEKQIYLDPDLRLDFFVKELGTNRTYLSIIIKENHNETFIGFINKYRVAEAQRIISDINNKLSLREIAEAVGFKSMSPFNLFFKRFTNQTPTEFRKACFKDISKPMG